MSRKKWIVKPYDKDSASEIAEALDINPYAALIVSSRGVKSISEAQSFFGLTEFVSVDPMDFPDMYPAVKRIQQALDNFERIAVYGDYDADGVTATSLLYSYLEMQGADVIYFVPDRQKDGYGLNFSAIDRICQMGAKLIITVDNGITAVDEAKYIHELEMELLITDHHLPSDELPQAVAVVDPHREDSILEFKDYAGVGVAYKLICALEGEENEVTESFLDLAAIGTIADVMPLINENREIVRRGLKVINSIDRLGIQALIDISGLNGESINSGNVAFGLVPRINAAGRMGSAERAVRLLLSEDYDDAVSYAEEINDANVSRHQIETEIFEQSVKQIEKNPKWKNDNVIVVDGQNWHEGVIGIVASRLVEKYGKPSIVITVSEGKAKGSGRSIDGFNLYKSLESCKEQLTHFGGHTLAAGVGLEPHMIESFRSAINEYAEGVGMPVPVQYIDFKINPVFVNSDILDVMKMLEPFGAGNTQPVFGLYNMTITDIQPIGNGKHLKITLVRDNTTLQVLKFRMTQAEFPYCKGDKIDAAVTVEGNEYLGQIRLSLFLKNIKLHDMNEDELFEQMDKFSRLLSSKSIENSQALLPDRNFVAKVYKFIRSAGRWNYDTEMLCYRLNLSAEYFGKVATSVEALVQLGILIHDENGGLALPENTAKVNLDDAPVLIRLRKM
ncbi:MAG: single-stranded-DNA-specific exonuclease RecJ [Ruminococcus sp.]|nr:single-stranded-DNA-specific exonuclease RecJ [Candidatus Copronaster equi]